MGDWKEEFKQLIKLYRRENVFNACTTLKNNYIKKEINKKYGQSEINRNCKRFD